MEVMFQPEAIYGYQMGGIHPAAYPRSYPNSRDTYSCYSYNPMLRAGLPEKRVPVMSGGGPGKTLQSVLLGEVPAAYTHLASQRSPVPTTSIECQSQVQHHHHQQHHQHHHQQHHQHQHHHQQPESVDQTEPMDLSVCKKSSSAFVVASHYHPEGTNSPPQGHSSPALSDSSSSEFSMLRNLLSVGRPRQDLSTDSRCDSPQEDCIPKYCTGSSRVTLAKKMLLPVSARVSDWLVKLIQFAKSVPEFCSLSHNDKITLILNSWSKMLLLFMAEHNFQFAVTPLPSNNKTTDSNRTDSAPSEIASPDEPSMKSVEGIQTFIRKCQHLDVDAEEYAFLKLLVLFNSGYIGLDRADVIDQLNSTVQQLLQQHVRVTRPNDVMHYSHLLLCLPSLYGTNSKMLETLFCQHITRNTDMEVLLKEMLQNI